MQGYLAIFKKFHKLENSPLFSSVMIHFADEPGDFLKRNTYTFYTQDYYYLYRRDTQGKFDVRSLSVHFQL